MTPPHLRVDDLRVVFRDEAGRDAPAVDGVSFALPRGATLGIVGESGSGKSTLARALLGFARPGARFAGGRVRLGETDVLALDAPRLRAFRGARAGMVPQNPLSSLTPHQPVGRQIVELIRQKRALPRAEAAAHALALMEGVGLPEPNRLAARYPHELSGGQRQRVVIAAALVARPELIVLDEPTTALDKTVEARVLDLVAQVQAELDATLVYVSHDLNVVSAVCREAMIMRAGHVVERGPTGALFQAPRTAYAQALVRAIPRLDRLSPRPALAPAPPALAVERLRFSYRQPGWRPWRRGARPPAAVDDVSFAVRPGETLGVLGESGSGKSTMAGVVAGVLAGHGGRIALDGAAVVGPARTRPRDVRRRIQMVFQDPLSSLNPAHSVGEILSRPLRRYFGLSAAAAQARAAAMLAELDLGPAFLRRRPRQLSGGQQQRVAIARALAAEPTVLICDEITSALDVTLQAQVLALLKRLQAERGLAILFISHDLAVVADIADQILVLERGQARDHGPRDRVLRTPGHPYAARLLRAFRRAEAAGGATAAAPAAQSG